MDIELKEVFDECLINYDKYDELINTFEEMKTKKDYSNYEYKIKDRICCNDRYYYCAEKIAIFFYKKGKYKEIIRKIYNYKTNIKVSSDLDRIDKGDF